MITKKPTKKTEASFLHGAGSAAGGAPKFKRVIVNFDPDLLARIDRAAKNKGLNRSAYIISTLGDHLEKS